MITIKAITEEGIKIPERLLTEAEQASTNFFKVYADEENYYYFESNEEQVEFLNALPEIEEPKAPSLAFEAFKQCTDEEKRIIAQSLKEFL